MQRFLVLLFALSIAVASCFAQVDTEFWFAPPEVTSGHGDGPVYIRVSSQDKPATVSILRPASANPEVITFTIAANTTRSINLGFVAGLETKPPATVLKTGIRVTSSAPITAYYEVGSILNGEIFVLKGKNALGNKFILVGQNFYNNNGNFIPTPYSSFDIVATQDNTLVTVKPTQPIFGHDEAKTIVVRLNAGETYSFKKPSLLARDNPMGTVVESSKPIAITIKDDSVINTTCSDLLGDQMIPVNVAGKEYIILKGSLFQQEFFFVTATENNTKIYLSGINVPIRELNAGEFYRHEIALPATYIKSDKKIYVLHVTGFGCEVGMAVLPPITCTGSKQIAFTRSTNEFFEMNILVRKEGALDFSLNGSTNLITGNKFIPVLGTNGEWYSAQIPFSLDQVPEGEASVIKNDHFSFQAGTINGNAGTSCRYGYFSSFSTLFIGDDFSMCNDQTAILDAGPGKESYLWNTGETTQKIEVSKTGDYWVRVITAECVLYDTIHVNVRAGHLDLGPDVEICDGDTTKIDGGENFSWQWSDGTIGQYLETTKLGKYWATVLDHVGCLATDTVVVKKLVYNFDADITARLNFVSVDTADQKKINLNWNVSESERLETNKIFLFKRELGTNEWSPLTMLPANKTAYQDTDSLTDKTAFEYYASLTNPCGEQGRNTKIHNTIRLAAVADTLSEVISFNWNPYREWDTGVRNYELWRKLDDNYRYALVAAIPGDQTSFSSKLTADGFVHQYVLRAIENSGKYESWSTNVKFKFENPIDIPNVFTPNGDPFNQTLYIRNITLYKECELEIFNRWGERVFHSIGYQNDWDGGNVSSGVYFYVLDLKMNGKILKGPISLVR